MLNGRVLLPRHRSSRHKAGQLCAASATLTTSPYAPHSRWAIRRPAGSARHPSRPPDLRARSWGSGLVMLEPMTVAVQNVHPARYASWRPARATACLLSLCSGGLISGDHRLPVRSWRIEQQQGDRPGSERALDMSSSATSKAALEGKSATTSPEAPCRQRKRRYRPAIATDLRHRNHIIGVALALIKSASCSCRNCRCQENVHPRRRSAAAAPSAATKLPR